MRVSYGFLIYAMAVAIVIAIAIIAIIILAAIRIANPVDLWWKLVHRLM